MDPEKKGELLISAAAGSCREGDAVSALQLLDQASHLVKNSWRLHAVRALAFMIRKDPASALAEERIAHQINPKESSVNNDIGKLLLDTGRYREAEPYLISAAQDNLYADSYKSFTNLGILKYREGELSASSKYLIRATELSPEYSCIAYYYLGHIALRGNRLGEAVDDYDRATRRYCVMFGDAQLALGIALERSGQYQKARKKFLDVAQSFPKTQYAQQAMERLKNLP